MKQIDLSIVNDSFLNSYIKTIDLDIIRSKLDTIKECKNIIDNLENILKADVNKIKDDYLNLCDGKSKEDIKLIQNAFNYKKYRTKESFIDFYKKLNIKSCPFCNNNYVYFYKDKSKKFNTICTLEHYYPKSDYPHLSLSFYNLIPSCYICNSKFKGAKSHVGKIMHPYIDDFHDKAKFSIDIEKIGVSKNINLKIKLNSKDVKCKKTIDRFQLDKIYEAHNDIAKEIWNKAQVYSESRINELYDSFYKNLGYTKEDVKGFVFCSYLNEKDINKRNHTKLTQDIIKELGLIK